VGFAELALLTRAAANVALGRDKIAYLGLIGPHCTPYFDDITGELVADDQRGLDAAL
jgi:hypothetical protein